MNAIGPRPAVTAARSPFPLQPGELTDVSAHGRDVAGHSVEALVDDAGRRSITAHPPAWDDAPVEVDSDYDLLAQPEPQMEFDQLIQW